jgi:hypothetical protein
MKRPRYARSPTRVSTDPAINLPERLACGRCGARVVIVPERARLDRYGS